MSCIKPCTLTAFVVLFFLLVCLRVRAQQVPSQDEAALSAAANELCHARIAMLGEIATHGDGHTLAFKVDLVKRLIDRCGFDSVLFEANQEEFLHLEQRLRSRQAVDSDDLLMAAGGLWRFYKEFQPLAPYLLERAQAGRVLLGGLDDQLGQFGQSYANDVMLSEFTRLLPEAERQGCATALRRRVYSDYEVASPYSRFDQSLLKNCLDHVQAAADTDATTTGPAGIERGEMISATRRWIERDFVLDDEAVASRDRSMYQTFEWWMRHHPKAHKVIVWAATVHIAKQVPPAWSGYPKANFGSFIHDRYGHHAAALGFSALTGSYRQTKSKSPTLPVAPEDSIEAQSLQAGSADAVYVNPRELKALGKRPGAFFYHSYQTLDWSQFLSGAVVFRSEHPPTDSRQK